MMGVRMMGVRMKRFLFLAIVLFLSLLFSASLVHAVPAFPGAEGFGANAVGGRGGRVIEVTNLNDSGSGSLRAALETSGPRIVVFRVAGNIVLTSAIDIRDPYVTIAGQTAPGDGITLRNVPSNLKSPLIVRTHDVVVRYIRSRPGKPGPGTGGSDNLGAIKIFNDQPNQSYNVIVDHCSLSWGTDEMLSTFYKTYDVSLQWNIVSEGLDCETDSFKCRSYGILVGESGGHSVSVHHNLVAHVVQRAPRMRIDGVVDVVNNVVYNWNQGAAHGHRVEPRP